LNYSGLGAAGLVNVPASGSPNAFTLLLRQRLKFGSVQKGN
jgi:hypothetical protein